MYAQTQVVLEHNTAEIQQYVVVRVIEFRLHLHSLHIKEQEGMEKAQD